MPWPIFIDGHVGAANEARVRADDPGFISGLAALDTMLLENGARVLERRHLARLERDCRALGIECPPAGALGHALETYVRALGVPDAALRTIVTRGTRGAGPSVVIAARPVEPSPASGVTLAIERRFVIAGDELDRMKTVHRARHAMARERAIEVGAFDALMLGTRGDVIEASTANLWAFVHGRFVTPPLSRGALDGVTRAVLLEEFAAARVPFDEAPLTLSNLAAADEIFLSSSIRRVVPVAGITDVARDLPGPAGAAAQHALALLLAAERRA